MKALGFLFCIFILISQSAFAQTTTSGNKGENYIKQIEGKIDKAKISIDKSCADINGSKSAENWYLKGYVYVELAKSAVYKNSVPNAAKEALKAIVKCKDLDVERKFESDCINLLFDLSTMFYDNGINLYNTALKSNLVNDYSSALVSLEDFFEVINTLGNDQTVVNHLIEFNKINKNSVIVYTAYCAQKSGDIEKAKKYYLQTILLNETNEKAKQAGTPLGYIYYSDLLFASGDTVNAKKTIEKGAKLYPDNPDVLRAAIDIFSKAKKVSEMTEFLQIAVQNNPSNAKMLVVLAGAYNTIAKDYLKKGYKTTSLEYRDKALKTYEKALLLKPTDNQLLFNINFNIGVIYYNPAVTSYKNRDESNQQEYEYLFKKSLPYLENAHKFDPSNRNVMNMLMKAYQTLNETGKAEAIEKELYK